VAKNRKKIDLTIDIAIYSLFYLGFLFTIFPLLNYLIAHFAANLPSYSKFFIEFAWFCILSLFLPVIFPIIIVGLCELYTNIFESWWIKTIIKCAIAIFFIFAIIAIPLPIAIEIMKSNP